MVFFWHPVGMFLWGLGSSILMAFCLILIYVQLLKGSPPHAKVSVGLTVFVVLVSLMLIVGGVLLSQPIY